MTTTTRSPHRPLHRSWGRNIAASAFAALVATLALTGCASNDTDMPMSRASSSSASESSGTSSNHNKADVAFASDMIEHHAQAIVMVDLAEGRDLTPEFRALTERIRAAQTPEIDTMTSWLEAWDEPVPDATSGMNGMNGMNGMDHGDMADDMAGMMSDADLADLEDASDDAFESMWLTMMIEHHEGAVTMSRTELADGVFAPALELADSIITSQTTEVAEMEAMLGS